MKGDSLTFGDAVQGALASDAVGIILRICLRHFHVVRKWLAHRAVDDHQKSLSTWLCGILPLKPDLTTINVVNAGGLPTDLVLSMDSRVVAKVIANVLVKQILLIHLVHERPAGARKALWAAASASTTRAGAVLRRNGAQVDGTELSTFWVAFDRWIPSQVRPCTTGATIGRGLLRCLARRCGTGRRGCSRQAEVSEAVRKNI
mmetsp:Transcript_20974/g.45714  ORF Transcript_20974/g.45714 Transcript_20974/m.45714 type:complete len:203 (+) Transcript_20974:371-979(+)